jgi:hypothetical protein
LVCLPKVKSPTAEEEEEEEEEEDTILEDEFNEE